VQLSLEEAYTKRVYMDSLVSWWILMKGATHSCVMKGPAHACVMKGPAHACVMNLLRGVLYVMSSS
jgi:hypothetical protein